MTPSSSTSFTLGGARRGDLRSASHTPSQREDGSAPTSAASSGQEGPNAGVEHLTKTVLKPAIDRAVAGMPRDEWRQNLNAIAGLLVDHGHHLDAVCVQLLKAKIKGWQRDHTTAGLTLLDQLMNLRGIGFQHIVMKKCLKRITIMATPSNLGMSDAVVREHASRLVHKWGAAFGRDARLIDFFGASSAVKAKELKKGIYRNDGLDGGRNRGSSNGESERAAGAAASGTLPPTNPSAPGVSTLASTPAAQGRMSDFHRSALRNSGELNVLLQQHQLGRCAGEASQQQQQQQQQQQHAMREHPEGSTLRAVEHRQRGGDHAEDNGTDVAPPLPRGGGGGGGGRQDAVDMPQLSSNLELLKSLLSNSQEGGGDDDLAEEVAERCRGGWKQLKEAIAGAPGDDEQLEAMIALNDSVSNLMLSLNHKKKGQHRPAPANNGAAACLPPQRPPPVCPHVKPGLAGAAGGVAQDPMTAGEIAGPSRLPAGAHEEVVQNRHRGLVEGGDAFDQLAMWETKVEELLDVINDNVLKAEDEALDSADLSDEDKAQLVSWIYTFAQSCKTFLMHEYDKNGKRDCEISRSALAALVNQRGLSGFRYLCDVQRVSNIGSPPPFGHKILSPGSKPGWG